MSKTMTLFTNSGPQNARATHLQTVNGWHLWSIDKWAEDVHSASIAIEFPGRGLVPFAVPHQMPRLIDHLNAGNDPFAPMKMKLEESLAKLRAGEDTTINLIAARLYDCYDEAYALATQRHAAREEERARQREEKARAEEAALNKEIADGEQKVRKGEVVSASTFELLIKKHNVDIHPRTMGWIRERLVEIGADSYRFLQDKGTGQKGSMKVSAAYRALQQALPPEPAPQSSPAAAPERPQPTRARVFASPRML